MSITAASAGINPVLCGAEWSSMLFPMKIGSWGKWPACSHPEHWWMAALPKSPDIFQDWSCSRPLFSTAFECRMPQSQHRFIELGTNVTDVSEHLFLLWGLWGRLCYVFLCILKLHLLSMIFGVPQGLIIFFEILLLCKIPFEGYTWMLSCFSFSIFNSCKCSCIFNKESNSKMVHLTAFLQLSASFPRPLGSQRLSSPTPDHLFAVPAWGI